MITGIADIKKVAEKIASEVAVRINNIELSEKLKGDKLFLYFRQEILERVILELEQKV